MKKKKRRAVEFSIKNVAGFNWKNVVVELFELGKADKGSISAKTNEDGVVKFQIKSMPYLARVLARNFVKEIILASDENKITIRLKSFFGIRHKSELISDSQLCNFCKQDYQSVIHRFNCKYCGMQHCSEHRIPENHNCAGIRRRKV